MVGRPSHIFQKFLSGVAPCSKCVSEVTFQEQAVTYASLSLTSTIRSRQLRPLNCKNPITLGNHKSVSHLELVHRETIQKLMSDLNILQPKPCQVTHHQRWSRRHRVYSLMPGDWNARPTTQIGCSREGNLVNRLTGFGCQIRVLVLGRSQRSVRNCVLRRDGLISTRCTWSASRKGGNCRALCICKSQSRNLCLTRRRSDTRVPRPGPSSIFNAVTIRNRCFRWNM